MTTEVLTTTRSTPTMADVARLAGVSTMTVSRALRPGSSVSPTTRQKILEIVERIGYVPDGAAGTLSSRRSGFVAVILPSLVQGPFAETARGLADTLSRQELQLLLQFTDHDPEREERAIESALRRRPEAVVLTGPCLSERAHRRLVDSALPLITMWDVARDREGSVIALDYRQAGLMVGQHLSERGARHLGFIGPAPGRSPRDDALHAGLDSHASTAGLAVPKTVRIGGPDAGPEVGARGIVQMMEQNPEVDGVLLTSDLAAFGAINACLRNGWEVPKRLRIISLGDNDILRHTVPPVTAVAVNAYAVGVDVGKVVLGELESRRRGQASPSQFSSIGFHIVTRGSS